METYAIDTNLLFNMEASLGLGENTENIIKKLTKAFHNGSGKIKIFIPASIKDEIESFFDNPDQAFLHDFFANITVKSPDLSALQIGAQTMSAFINESRSRNQRGMQIGQECIEEAGSTFMGKENLPKKDFQIKIGSTIKTFRERYRNATRTGFIDSQADFELIMLAREQGAFLVTTDAGLIVWGRQFGVKEMTSTVFGKKMQAYL